MASGANSKDLKKGVTTDFSVIPSKPLLSVNEDKPIRSKRGKLPNAVSSASKVSSYFGDSDDDN